MPPKKGYKWTDEHRINHKVAMQKLAQDLNWRRKNKEQNQKNTQDPVWQDNNKKSKRKLAQDSVWQDNHTRSMQLLHQDPIWLDNHKRAMGALTQTYGWKLKQKEGRLGGFWYGSVEYQDRPGYCELWCPDLWHRIDEAQNYQSILSGKTKFENGGRALDRHHVYWQPKACCKWDEDVGGYYAMINIGTKGKPNWYKHYILGDPNKFVLLTAGEHDMIRKDKIKWIKIFEDLIETKLGGICYIPEKQMVVGE